MPALSIARDGKTRFVVAANPIYLTSEADLRSGARISFEVMEKDCSLLRELKGMREYYTLDGGPPFWGELLSLEIGASTHPALSMLRHEPVLCGVFLVHGDASAAH